MPNTYTLHNQFAPMPATVEPSATPVARPQQDINLAIALEHARRLTTLYGTDNIQVALAWETVEELLTAKARRRETSETSLEAYCRLHPDAPECRVYDV